MTDYSNNAPKHLRERARKCARIGRVEEYTVNELFTVVAPHAALELLLARCGRIARTQNVALSDAQGRVTAAEIRAEQTLPAFARSTMDGYAVIAAETFGASESAPAYLHLCGEVTMGSAPTLAVGSLQAARIHTGAMLPRGADAVVMIEDTNAHGDNIEVLAAAASGENIIGIGEDVRAGEIAVAAGRRLRPQDAGGLAALGCTIVRIVERPRIAILSTGDEVVAPGREPAIGQVRDVNATTIAAVVSAAGGVPDHVGIIGDDLSKLDTAARNALHDADALVLSAGSSVSVRDLTAQVVEALGRPGILVHGIAIKPGKPTLFAIADGKPILGLPGNPASALIVAWLLLAPLVRRLGGEEWPAQTDMQAREREAIVTAPVRSRPGREDYVACTLETVGAELRATPIFGKSNSIFTLVRADGLIVVPLDQTGLAAGATVRVVIP